MFRLYRPIEPGEFFVVGGDTSQGGADYNAVQFLSKTKLDVPLVYHARGVAASMTPELFRALERIYDITGLAPMVALERNNGGASEMERLVALNREEKYEPYVMHKVGSTSENDETTKYGFDTTPITRSDVIGQLKYFLDRKVLKIYDEATIKEARTFVINASGKVEAAPNNHDDLVMALGIAVQLYNRVVTPVPIDEHAPQQSEELFTDGWY